SLSRLSVRFTGSVRRGRQIATTSSTRPNWNPVGRIEKEWPALLYEPGSAFVGPPHPIGEDAHDVQGKGRPLFDHEFEAFLINGHQPAVGFGDRSSAARRIVDHSHLADECSGRKLFERSPPALKIYLPRQHDVHQVSRLPLREDGGARRVVFGVLGFFE